MNSVTEYKRIEHLPKPHVPDNVAPTVVDGLDYEMKNGIQLVSDSRATVPPEGHIVEQITSEYNKKARLDRLSRQYKKLVAKINYMNKLTNVGRNFKRNSMCPCRSGKKFKNCCISIHDRNGRRVMQLQTAMDKLLDKVSGLGYYIGRKGVSQ